MFEIVSLGSAKVDNMVYNSLISETLSQGELMSKRMQLKLDDETYELIKELSEVSGMSASSLVTVMFQASRVDLHSIIAKIRDLQIKPKRVFESVLHTLEYNHSGGGPYTPRRAKGTNVKGGKQDV